MFEPVPGGTDGLADLARTLDFSPSRLVFGDAHAAIYTVGQVCGMLGVQPAFLRRLDAEEIVRPARSDGHHRRYSRQQILDVEHVLNLTGGGLTLAGVKRVLVLEAQVRKLERRIATMDETDKTHVREHHASMEPRTTETSR